MSESGEANPEHRPGDRPAEEGDADTLPNGEDQLPSPEMLAQYESILPGLAERIVSDWERSQAHRRNREK